MNRIIPLCFAALLASCSSSDGDRSPTANATDAGPDSTADASPFLTCEASCAQTSISITLGGNTLGLNRAQFGFDKSDTGEQLLYIEAHFGGDSACPSESSPSPDRTVIFAHIPVPSDSTPIEGTPVTLLDFKGDLTSNPLEKATKVKLTPVAINTTAAAPFVAFDVEVTFATGTMTGHLYATHCDSLDE